MRTTHGPFRDRRVVAMAFSILGVVLGSTLVGVAQAEATSYILCTGFAQCEDRDRSDSGYQENQSVSHWNAAAGTNCTNYVAYRLTSNGRRTARPPGTNAASTWGAAATASGLVVDAKPKVGDIAWWDANVYPAGAKGHVAYVERVYSAGSVLVSEDNMNKAFTWRKVTRGKGFPSGFIHFPESDGTPSGLLTGLSSSQGTLDLWTAASDPDAFGRPVRYTVVIDGYLSDGGVESYSFVTSNFVSHRITTVRTRGTRTVRVYAHNKKDTDGSAFVRLGTRTVTIR